MVGVDKFVATLDACGVNFFTGVPDSLLKSFCAYLTDKGCNLIAANEYSLGADPFRPRKCLREIEEDEKAGRVCDCIFVPLMAKGLIRQTLLDKPKSRFQRHALA